MNWRPCHKNKSSSPSAEFASNFLWHFDLCWSMTKISPHLCFLCLGSCMSTHRLAAVVEFKHMPKHNEGMSIESKPKNLNVTVTFAICAMTLKCWIVCFSSLKHIKELIQPINYKTCALCCCQLFSTWAPWFVFYLTGSCVFKTLL